MKLRRLELTNIRSHSHLDLDLSTTQCAAIVGRNGSGKSTILQSVSWALFGGGSPDDMLRYGSDRGGVTLELEQDGVAWQIARGRQRAKKSWLAVERAGESVTRHTMAETQGLIIEQITGMDEEAFACSVYAPQGEAGMLAAMTPGDRKGLLGALLGLDRYEEWRSAAALEGRGVAERVLVVDAGIEEREEKILRLEFGSASEESLAAARAEITAAEKRLAEAEAGIDQAIERERAVDQVLLRGRLTEQMAERRTQGKLAGERNDQRRVLREKLAAAVGAEEGLTVQENARREFERRQDAAVAASQQAEQAMAEAVRRVDELGAQVSALGVRKLQATKTLEKLMGQEKELMVGSRPQCPTCGQTVEDAHLMKVRTDLTARINEERTQDEGIGEELVTLGREKLAAENELSIKRQLVDASPAQAAVEMSGYDPAAYKAAREAVGARQRVQGALGALGPDVEDVAALKAQWVDLKAQRDVLPDEAPEGISTSAARVAREEAAGARSDAQERLRAMERDRVEAERLREELTGLEAEVGELRQRGVALDVAGRAFSRDGIPAMILDNATAGIESAANEALERLGTSLRLSLVTQRQKKSGKGVSETLEIMVDDGVFERPLASFSGGERYRVHVALRMGLGEMLAAGSGKATGVLLIDEPTDLDEAGVTMLAELLTVLSAERQVLLVTHSSELVHALPTRIVVDRPDHGPSRVAVA